MIRRVLLLRGWAILAVICNHTTGWGFIAMFWWVHRYRPVISPNYDQVGTLAYYGLMVFQQLTLFSVPAFLFISGLFIAYAARGASSLNWKVIKARLSNLLWPYFIWSVVILIGDALLEKVYSPLGYLKRLVTGGAVDAYFFIPLLVQFYLLSPFIVRSMQARPRFLFALSAAFQLAVVSIPYLGGVWGSAVAWQRALKALDWTFVRWAFFFILGVFLGFQHQRVGNWLARHKWELLTVTVLLGTCSVLESQQIYRSTFEWDWACTPLKLSSVCYTVAFILTFLAWSSRPSSFFRGVEQVGRMSYGIYLLHPKVVEMTARVIYHVSPWLLAHQVLYQPVLVLLALGIPVLVMRGVLKLGSKRFYSYLFG